MSWNNWSTRNVILHNTFDAAQGQGHSKTKEWSDLLVQIGSGWTMMRNTLVNMQELLLKRLKECLKTSLPIYEHQSSKGHRA